MPVKTLEYDFSTEKSFSYKGLSMDEIIHHLAFFVSRLWQIHVFAEGNTRTTAVFFIKYLKTLGFDVTNDIFAENAWYFRNALVRANYNNLKKNIHGTTKYLENFLRNLLLDQKNPLHNRTMHISGIFDDFEKQDIGKENQDIQESKQDIQRQKQDIDVTNLFKTELEDTHFSTKTIRNIEALYDKYGNQTVFGRSDIIDVLKITASPASELINKLLKSGIIMPVNGMGKGKYIFRK